RSPLLHVFCLHHTATTRHDTLSLHDALPISKKATSYMATRAAEQLLEKTGVAAEEIDAIILATVTPDMFFPATACLVQANIGATRAWGFDLSAACSRSEEHTSELQLRENLVCRLLLEKEKALMRPRSSETA